MKRLYLNLIDIIAFILNKIFGISFIIIPKVKKNHFTLKSKFLVDNKYIFDKILRMTYHDSDLTSIESIKGLVNTLKPYKVDKELIRFGNDSDGGYLIPNDLDDIIACFSPGVETLAYFEKDCVKRGIKCFLADASVEKAPVENSEDFQFIKMFLNAYNDETNITLDKWVSQSLNGEKGDLLLQMDIESAELETILSTSEETLDRFRIIIIEVHTMQSLILRSYYQIFNAMIMKLLNNHTCVHIHPNNCTPLWRINGDLEMPETMELTFLRNDRIKTKSPATTFPHPLDFDNTAYKQPLNLPKCMYE